MDETKLDDILFLDIETVPAYENYNALPEKWKQLWNVKASHLARNNESPEELYHRAGIYAEFGKIICIAVGFFDLRNGRTFRIKSFTADNEKQLLTDFADLLNRHFNQRKHRLAAHNGKEFDFPFTGRRMLVNNVTLPRMMRLQGMRGWEVKHIDTMELWKFGDIKSFTSLDLLTTLFDIPSPKENMDGSKVYEIYYQQNDMPAIIQYCKNDVLALAQLYLRLNNIELLKEEEIMMV
jgi:3'-5' exonuclease